MKILIVSSTIAEIEPFLKFLESPVQIKENFSVFQFLDNEIAVFICGIGSYSFIYNFTKILLHNSFDFVINVGIAGAFNKILQLCDVVFVKRETIGDLGINDNGNFKTLIDLNFVNKDQKPFSNGSLISSSRNVFEKLPHLRIVNGLTLNTVTGEDNQADYFREKFDVDIETMEGAAFFYVCLMENVAFVEMRAISNYVGKRDKSKWQMTEAIKRLNYELKLLIMELLKKQAC